MATLEAHTLVLLQPAARAEAVCGVQTRRRWSIDVDVGGRHGSVRPLFFHPVVITHHNITHHNLGPHAKRRNVPTGACGAMNDANH